jgi:hypothetical protein
MPANKTPLQQVNDEHGGKQKLVDKLVGLLDSDDKDSLKNRLLTASNKKLLRLAQISETVKSKYGSPAKMAESVAGLVGRAKDSDYVKKLTAYTPGRLLDMAESLAKRAKGAASGAASKAKATAAKTVTKSKAAAKTAAKTATAKTTTAKAKKAK